MLRTLLVATALWSLGCHANAQVASGVSLVCYAPASADAIANSPTTARAQATIREEVSAQNCLMAEFRGEELGEYRTFSIGRWLYTWMRVQINGAVVYVLRPDGEGSVA